MSNESAHRVVIDGLKQALTAHREGRLFDIGNGWDEAAAIERDDRRVSIALNLWEGWADAAAHQWQYYEGIGADDWPRMANRVIEWLEHDREVLDPEILERFMPRPRTRSALSRLLERIGTLLGSR